MTERISKAQLQALNADLTQKLRDQIGRANFFKQERDRLVALVTQLKQLLSENHIDFVDDLTHQDCVSYSRNRFKALAEEYGYTNVMRSGEKFYVRHNKALKWELAP